MDIRIKSISEHFLWLNLGLRNFPFSIELKFKLTAYLYEIVWFYLSKTKNWILMKMAMTLILDLDIWLKITANPLTKVQLMWSMCRIYDTEIFVKTSLIWPWPKNFVQGHCTIFDQGTLLVKYKPDWIKRKEYMIQSRFFFI